jgi:hypothetical protein
MKILSLSLISVILLVGSTGCMHLRVIAVDDYSNPVPEKVKRTTYFWGLKQKENIRTAERCKSICSVTTKTTFGNVAISFLTLGIVVPQQLEYRCCPYEPPPAEE